MVTEDSDNPFQSPQAANDIAKTEKGFSLAQCFFRFFFTGLAAGGLAGIGMAMLNAARATAWSQLGVAGIAFGVALWWATQRFVARISMQRTVSIVLGCIGAFLACGVAYEYFLVDNWYVAQPMTWELLRPYVFGPTVSVALMSVVIRLAGGPVPVKVLVLFCVAGSLLGFTTIFVIDEIGTRRRLIYEPILAAAGGMIYIALMLALIGWNLAVADTNRRCAV